MKPLFVPLKSEYFDAFMAGIKTSEWRLYGPRWNERTCVPGREVILSKGYGKAHRLTGIVLGTTQHRIDDPQHPFNRVYGERAKGAVALEIKIRVAR
jgi:hypothetical protein